MKDEQSETSKQEDRQRLPYQPPTLVCYGSVATLTQQNPGSRGTDFGSDPDFSFTS